MVAVVDDEDYPSVRGFNWTPMRTRSAVYARRTTKDASGRRVAILMHRALLGVSDSKTLVDHRNHDGLDNRRENLRSCTETQNQGNRQKSPGKSSVYKGVNWVAKKRKWRAYITRSYKFVHLGEFSSEEAAAAAYDKAARETFGEFALVNFPAVTP